MKLYEVLHYVLSDSITLLIFRLMGMDNTSLTGLQSIMATSAATVVFIRHIDRPQSFPAHPLLTSSISGVGQYSCMPPVVELCPRGF